VGRMPDNTRSIAMCESLVFYRLMVIIRKIYALKIARF
jgi:hypothetical protein